MLRWSGVEAHLVVLLSVDLLLGPLEPSDRSPAGQVLRSVQHVARPAVLGSGRGVSLPLALSVELVAQGGDVISRQSSNRLLDDCLLRPGARGGHSLLEVRQERAVPRGRAVSRSVTTCSPRAALSAPGGVQRAVDGGAGNAVAADQCADRLPAVAQGAHLANLI